MKKMQKVIWRNGNSRPPKDAEEYVKRFVLYWRDYEKQEAAALPEMLGAVPDNAGNAGVLPVQGSETLSGTNE